MLKSIIITVLLLPTLLLTFQSSLVMANKVSPARLKQQVLLDQQCEKDRQKSLAPRKREIYQECLKVFKKSKKICEEEATVYNGKRINGAPLFYELPSCVKAFNYREESKKNSSSVY